MRALLAAVAILLVLLGLAPGGHDIRPAAESVAAAADASFDADTIRLDVIASAVVRLAAPLPDSIVPAAVVPTDAPRTSARTATPLRL
ncbi:MAG: hypothetical protein U0P30_05730 [Vicinamibacterales bacterium]